MSNNLELAQVAAAQNQKEVTINDQAGQLDAGLTDKVDVALTGTTSPLVLSDAQALRCMVLKLTGTHPGGAYEVHCPTNKKIYVVWNSTAGDVTFKTVAGTGIPVNAGAVLILYCDGTNVIQLAGLVATIDDIGDVVITAAASGQMLRFNGSSWVNEDSPYDVGMFIPGTHGNGALLAQVVLTRAVSFADDFAGARAYAGVSATAETVLDVHRNGSPIGTITFGIGASAGTFATAGGGAETFAAGIASRSSTRTRRMPRSPISRSPFSARGPDHGLGFRHGGHPADQHHDGAVLQPGPDAQPAGDGARAGVGRLPGSRPTTRSWRCTPRSTTPEVWDLIPMMEFLIENTTDPNRISFLVTGVYKFRVGVRRSGSTDTITSADLSLRKDGVNA